MSLHLIAQAARDGGGSTITGGVHFNDESGTGAGPNNPAIVVIDSTQSEILGTTADAAVNTDANGSINAHLRGVVKLLAAGISAAVTQAGNWAMRLQDGAGTAITSTGSALDVNIKSRSANGRATPANSEPVVQASQVYNTVAASATAQALTGGSGGATGDWLDFLLVIPASTSPGNVLIKDGSGSNITLFAGGASSVSSLVPFAIPVRAVSAAGAWAVTTGLNVSVIAVGNFH